MADGSPHEDQQKPKRDDPRADQGQHQQGSGDIQRRTDPAGSMPCTAAWRGRADPRSPESPATLRQSVDAEGFGESRV